MLTPYRQFFCLFVLLLADPGRAGVDALHLDSPVPRSIARVEQVYPFALRYRTQMLEEIEPAPVLVNDMLDHKPVAVPEWTALPLEAEGTFPIGNRSLYVLMSLQR